MHREGKLEGVLHPVFLIYKSFLFVVLIKVSIYLDSETLSVCVLHSSEDHCTVTFTILNANLMHASHLHSVHIGRWILPKDPLHTCPPLAFFRSFFFLSFPPCFRENTSSCLLFLWHLFHLSFLLFFHLFVQSQVSVKGTPRVGMAAWHKLSRLPMSPLGPSE